MSSWGAQEKTRLLSRFNPGYFVLAEHHTIYGSLLRLLLEHPDRTLDQPECESCVPGQLSTYACMWQ